MPLLMMAISLIVTLRAIGARPPRSFSEKETELLGKDKQLARLAASHSPSPARVDGAASSSNTIHLPSTHSLTTPVPPSPLVHLKNALHRRRKHLSRKTRRKNELQRMDYRVIPDHLRDLTPSRRTYYRHLLFGQGRGAEPGPPQRKYYPIRVLELAYNMRVGNPDLTLRESLERATAEDLQRVMGLEGKQIAAIGATGPAKELLHGLTSKYINIFESTEEQKQALEKEGKFIHTLPLPGPIKDKKAAKSVYNQRYIRKKRWERQKLLEKGDEAQRASASSSKATTTSAKRARSGEATASHSNEEPSAKRTRRPSFDLNEPPASDESGSEMDA